MIELTLKRAPTVPLEAEVLTPDVLSELSESEIRALIVYHGKRQLRLDEFFEVQGEKSSHIRLSGAMHKVRWIGREMSHGRIDITGNVGMHLGAFMKGGEIRVQGDASDWVGAEMRKGTIHISGNAGGQIGGAYRGSTSGMKNGVIHIGGTAGLEVGLHMRRGTIVAGGLVRDFSGLQMKGGTIVLLQGAELRTGAWMNRGTIISLKPLQLMPTFRPSGKMESPFFELLARHLKSFQIDLDCLHSNPRFQRYVGDNAIPGKGEILVLEDGEQSGETS